MPFFGLQAGQVKKEGLVGGAGVEPATSPLFTFGALFRAELSAFAAVEISQSCRFSSRISLAIPHCFCRRAYTGHSNLRHCSSSQFFRRTENRLRLGKCFQPPYEADQGLKAAVRQDFLQPSFGLGQAIVVPEPRLPSSFKARLIGIEFPGVEVDNYRLPIPLVDCFDGPTSKPQREQSQIAATSDREIYLADPQGRGRYFPDGSSRWEPSPVNPAGSVWDSIEVVMDGENTRIIFETLLSQNLKRP